jgi:hypothetical protein
VKKILLEMSTYSPMEHLSAWGQKVQIRCSAGAVRFSAYWSTVQPADEGCRITSLFASFGSMQSGAAWVTIPDMPISNATMQGPAVYRVRVQGRVPLDWSSLLMGMNITTTNETNEDESTLVGRLRDQAALSGVLNTLYEKQYPVLSVECLEVG